MECLTMMTHQHTPYLFANAEILLTTTTTLHDLLYYGLVDCDSHELPFDLPKTSWIPTVCQFHAYQIFHFDVNSVIKFEYISNKAIKQ